MKKILLLITVLVALSNAALFAQTDKTDSAPPPPYKKVVEMPAFNIIELDSTTVFNTTSIKEGRPTLLFFFGADCDHCQKTLDRMLAGWDSLKHVDVYMMSFSLITPIKKFYEKNHLENYKNIKVVGMDKQFFFSAFYDVHAVPGLALYDKHKRFVGLYDGHVSIKELWEDSKKAGKTQPAKK